MLHTWWSSNQSMLDAGRPALARAASIDCGTTRTAKRKTSLPFIWRQENEARLGGKPKTEPLEPNSSVSLSLKAAFRCLQREGERVEQSCIREEKMISAPGHNQHEHLKILHSLKKSKEKTKTEIEKTQTCFRHHHYANQKQAKNHPHYRRPT